MNKTQILKVLKFLGCFKIEEHADHIILYDNSCGDLVAVLYFDNEIYAGYDM